MPHRDSSSLPPRLASTLRAVSYLRVSTDSQTEKFGLEIQRVACQQYAREHGYTIVHEYLEGDGQRGVSGGNTDRPTITRLLQDATRRPQPFEKVLVYDTSRVARDDSVWYGGWIEERLLTQQVVIEYVSERFTQDPASQLYKQIVRGINAYQKQNTTIRDREGIVARAKQGLWPGGNPPLGYDVIENRLTLNPEEAQLVERIFRLYAERGLTTIKIGAQLYQERIPGKWARLKTNHQRYRQSVWDPGTIYLMLHNTVYIGRFVWGRKKNPRHQTWLSNERVEIPCPRIISDELWAAAQRRLAANRIFGRRDKKSLYLLSGLIRCETCGWALQSISTKRAALSYYFCGHLVKAGRPDCTNRARFRVADVDPVIWQVLTEGLTDPQRVQELLMPHLEVMAEEGEASVRLHALQERLAALEQKAAEVLQLDTSTALAREHVTKLLAQLDLERAALQHEEAALQARGKGGERLPTSGTAFFQQIRQWLLGSTLADVDYEDSRAGQQATAGKAALLTAPVPAELHAFLFQLKRHIVRELVSAVYVGPDGSGAIVLRDNNNHLPLQVTAQPPKMTLRSLKRKMRSA
jgi:site-specific DNA recombinase